MAFVPHYRLTMRGRIGTNALAPLEFFSIGLALGNRDGTAVPQSAFGNAMDDVTADCVAFFARPDSNIGGDATLTEVKIAPINSLGKYSADPAIREVSQAGGVPRTNPFPPQVSLVASFNTGKRGPSGRGRFYLPCPGSSLGADLRLTANTAELCESSVAQLIRDLNNLPGLDFSNLAVVVASSKAVNSPITQVRVGRALDTMRSRRRNLAEDYREPTVV